MGFSSFDQKRLILQQCECASSGIARPQPQRGRGHPSRYCWRSAFGDLLDSGAPLPIEVTGVPPHGFIPGQSLDDFSRKKDEVAAVEETSHALDEKEEDFFV